MKSFRIKVSQNSRFFGGMAMYGYAGKLLRVDLSEKSVKEEPLKLDYMEKFLGGNGIAARILYDEVAPHVDPLDPENRLIFITGPFTGTKAPCTGKHTVISKSPLTGIFGESIAGGRWGVDLKWSGFDGIVVGGRAEKPVYLWVHEGGCEIRSGGEIWGKSTFETDDIIKEELGEKRVSVCSIGPAGEQGVKFANIINDKGRAAGRCGLGAVMGSKNLKAIAVHGTKKPEVKDEETFEKICTIARKAIMQHIMTVTMFKPYGTSAWVDSYGMFGDVPTKYWQLGDWQEGYDKISGVELSKYLKKLAPCYGCPISCGRIVEIKTPPFGPLTCSTPEYETVAALGSLCLNDNIESIIKLGNLCDLYGMDTISTGTVLAFAMYLREKGIITVDEMDGVDLTWGNYSAMMEMMKRIVEREGFGAIGKGAEKYAMHVKGLEVPMHDPRAFHSMALQYTTVNRGAFHMVGFPLGSELGIVLPDVGLTRRMDRFDDKGKAELVILHQQLGQLTAMFLVCIFGVVGWTVTNLLRAFKALTGRKLDMKNAKKIGERVFTLKRVFNIRCGVTGKDDKLPPLISQPLKEGGTKGHVPNFEYQLKEYYRLRNWTEDGKPTKEKLIELGLEKEARDLYG
jgi:aldehyde:ferredoxin oxidoreductase